MNQNAQQIIKDSISTLNSLYDIQQSEVILWWMLSAITGKTKLELVLCQEELAPNHMMKLQQWIDEHINQNKPLAYLIGTVPFINCTIAVEPPLLIPRPETEEWVACLIEKLRSLPNKKITILDLCTGSGAIACALAHAFPEATLIAADISEKAIEITKRNAVLNEVSITCIQSNLYSALKGFKFDLVVTNPPYISAEAWVTLDPMVKTWEDYNALVAPEKGLGLIRAICEQTPEFLCRNSEMVAQGIAQLYCEIGYDQGKAAYNLMKQSFSDVQLIKDYNKQDRVVCGFLKDLLPIS